MQYWTLFKSQMVSTNVVFGRSLSVLGRRLYFDQGTLYFISQIYVLNWWYPCSMDLLNRLIWTKIKLNKPSLFNNCLYFARLRHKHNVSLQLSAGLPVWPHFSQISWNLCQLMSTLGLQYPYYFLPSSSAPYYFWYHKIHSSPLVIGKGNTLYAHMLPLFFFLISLEGGRPEKGINILIGASATKSW